MAFTNQKHNYIIETERLLLREFDPETDAKDAFELNSNPEVVKYTGDESFNSIETAYTFLKNYRDYSENGMGRWAIITKADGAFIGWCGLKKHEDAMIDLGFRLNQESWGKGYATEAALACLKYGFELLNIQTIIGRVARENTASIKVLEKCGFRYWKNDSCEGIEDSLYYKINKEDFM